MSAGESTPPSDSRSPLLHALHARDKEGISVLRHTLRTPLNQIMGYAELMMETAEEDGIATLLPELKAIHRGGEELLGVINEGLAPWKTEAGKADFAALRLDLRKLLAGVMSAVEAGRAKARALGRVSADEDLGKILRAARALLALAEESPSEEVSPSVQSNPVGESQRPFPFATGDPFPPDDGLAAVRVAAKLLVVEDDGLNREILHRRLQKLGHHIVEATNGREALARLKEGSFDLVLLDILMPDMDGFQALEFIKADPRLKHIPVIMLTALDDVESTVRCIEAGAEDYVPKPFNPVVLRARINASLEKKRFRDQEQAFLRQLQTERAKSERLLLNVLPKAIAERLKSGQRTIVDSFVAATVLFADIVGFAHISAQQSPQRTVELLNELFSRFDRIAEKHELEKIKTIGDAYMMVGGVPVVRGDHAPICAAAAFEILDALAAFNRKHGLAWSIRIGMNSGPVVAGIIGTRKFSYDLWGDTVNIASRMESHGRPDRIQVSEATRQLLGHRYSFEPVGVIEIKNAAAMPTYLLHRSSAG